MSYQVFDKTHPAKSNKGPSETQFLSHLSYQIFLNCLHNPKVF